MGGIQQGRRGDGDEELVLAGGEIRQQVNVDPLGAAHGQIVVATGRIAGASLQIGIGEARFEHDDLVLAARVGQLARVPRVLLAQVVERIQVHGAIRAVKPLRPVQDVGAIADAVWPPAVVGVADEVVVVPQSEAQVAVAIGQPVFSSRVVDEDQLDHLVRWVGVVSLGCNRPGRPQPGENDPQQQGAEQRDRQDKLALLFWVRL